MGLPLAKNTRLIAAVVIVVVVIAAAIILLRGQYGGEVVEAPEEAAMPQEGAEVEARVIEVDLFELAINPSTIEVEQGETIRFVIRNTGNFPHALAIVNEEIGFRASSEVIGGGGETELVVTFEQPGQYEIYCPVANHRELGMVGSLIVS